LTNRSGKRVSGSLRNEVTSGFPLWVKSQVRYFSGEQIALVEWVKGGEMSQEIAILGTGAVGSSLGADLAKAGYKVMLIDQWPAHVEAMKTNGLHIKMPSEEVHTPVKALHLCELCGLQPQFDIVFLAAKSYDTQWLVEFIKPYLKSSGVLVSLQNSLNDEWISPVIGFHRDVASVVELSAELFEPGRVQRNMDRACTWFALGELDGRITPRVKEIARILSHTAKVDITTNIWGAKWSKLVLNSMTSGMCGILYARNWELAQRPELRRICIKLGRESLQVATTLGYSLEPLFGLSAEDLLASTDEVLEKNLFTISSNIGTKARTMILQDHLKGRRSEVDYTNGLIVKKGKEAGVPTPVNEIIVSLNKQIEQGVLKPDPSNFTLMEQLVAKVT
jgi:2-dehydropantoate 2-reductase